MDEIILSFRLLDPNNSESLTYFLSRDSIPMDYIMGQIFLFIMTTMSSEEKLYISLKFNCQRSKISVLAFENLKALVNSRHNR